MTRIKKILIANRGEIAIRVMRTCRDMGIASVALYTKVDRTALHVRYATEAYQIDSYLNIQAIIDVAKKSGADAIHPGYGFLSENADFADAVQKSGLIFIGPRASSIKSMGSKTGARQVMQAAGVPVVPGLTKASPNSKHALEAAKKIGFPVMLKAAAGGGGRGMRKIDSLKDFESAYESAQSEARNSFGDDSVYIEKFLEQPRHIEVQVFADTHGNVISFPERECSVQRRHQKVIEESPSCFVNPNMRERMGEVARQAAQAVNYIGAGTVEFLVDAHKNFYFMEMNTRLQVEHPITEMISGFDLVEMQIQIAQGGLLTVKQDELKANGWAIEARVCAEDPDNNFLPTPGLIKHFKEPSGPYVRIDAAAYSGYQIPTEYDSMIGKVIAWAPTRKQAIKRLDRALSELIIKGCTTNISFLRQLLNFEEFLSGDYDTGLIGRFQEAQPKSMGDEHETIALLGAALFAYIQDKQPAAQNKQSPDTALSAWQLMGHHSIGFVMPAEAGIQNPSRHMLDTSLRWYDKGNS